MSVINRRNAMVGWAAWKVSKVVLRRKTPTFTDRVRERWYLLAGGAVAVTAVAGTVVMLKRGRDNGAEPVG